MSQSPDRLVRLPELKAMLGGVSTASGPGATESAVCSAAYFSSTFNTQRRNALATGVRANMATRWQPRREKMRQRPALKFWKTSF